jgi:schlafen family protein
MIDKRIEDVAIDDVRRLVANKVPESRSLEYKQELPGGTDVNKKEFLADVSSFANGAGGDLVFGVSETREDGKTTGIPEAADGLSGVNTDAETRRLESMLRDGIAPRLHGVHFRWVQGFAKGPSLIIRIPRSWAGPHMVTYQQHSRFYARNAGGKYPLDVFELRQAFIGSGSLTERAREFRSERLGRLLAGELPISLQADRMTCVHFIPHASLAGAVDVDLLTAANQRDLLQPLYSHHSGSQTYNLDGLLTYLAAGERLAVSYLQLFRDGIVETVTAGLLADRTQHGVTLPSVVFAEHLFQFLSRARRLMGVLDIEPPASLYVSFIGARSGVLGVSHEHTIYNQVRPFDRDVILLREVLVREWVGDPHIVLNPLLNELWQTAGFSRCLDYDDQGNWKRSRS